MNLTVTAEKLRIIAVTVGEDPLSLRALIAAESKTLPPGAVLQVSITPTDPVTLTELNGGGQLVLAADTTRVIPVCDCLDYLTLECASGTVDTVLELYIGGT